MKLSKTDPQTSIELDMTPMIDVVFQLIIFFMLLMDMSQTELEQLHLPSAVTAAPDKPDPLEIRPVINILSSGEILVKRDLIFDPNADDQYAKLKDFLAGMAKRMPKEPLDETKPNGKKVPANALLIRADRSTPFKHIQKVMEVCGIEGIQIWKVQLAAAEGAKDEDAEGAAATPNN